MTLHHSALPRLRQRMLKIGHASEDADAALAWIRDEAPTVIHIDLAEYGLKLAADTNYRNQFETDTSRGCLSHETRKRWESDLFGDAYSGASAVDRCKYGVLNVTNDPQGVRKCSSYGSSYLLLRNVRLRTTFAARDSGGIHISELATVDYYAHVLEKYTDEELRAAVEVGTRQTLGRDSEVISQYKEAQIHGEIRLAENVEVIMAHPSLRTERHKDMLKQLSERCQAPVVWIEADARTCDLSLESELDGEDFTFTPCVVDPSPAKDLVADTEVDLALAASHHSAEASAGAEAEIELALAVSHADAADASALAKVRAAEEARELQQAIELSASFSDLDEAIRVSLLASQEVLNSDEQQRQEESELANAIEASLESGPPHDLGWPPAGDLKIVDGDVDDKPARAIEAAVKVLEGPPSPVSPELVCAAQCGYGGFSATKFPLSSALQDERLAGAPGSSMDTAVVGTQPVRSEISDSTAALGVLIESEHPPVVFEGSVVAESPSPSGLDHMLHNSATPVLHEPRHTVGHMLKASLVDDTRRVEVAWHSDASSHDILEALFEVVRTVFSLQPAREFALKCMDEDGDVVALLECTVRQFISGHRGGPLRIYVEVLG